MGGRPRTICACTAASARATCFSGKVLTRIRWSTASSSPGSTPSISPATSNRTALATAAALRTALPVTKVVRLAIAPVSIGVVSVSADTTWTSSADKPSS